MIKTKQWVFATSLILILAGIIFVRRPLFASDAPLSHLRVLRRTPTSLTILWDSPLRTALGISSAAIKNPRTHRITVIDETSGKIVKKFATSQGLVTISNLKEDRNYIIRVRGGYAAKNKPALTKHWTTAQAAE